jgi:hypothetical protein
MGISLTSMGAMTGLLSGESYLIGFSLVLGTTSGISFGLWMIDNPELWRGIGISSLEPAWLQGDVLLGKRNIRRSRVLSAGIYFLVVIFGYWIGRAILLHEPFAANFPGQLWIIPVSLLLAISLLFSKNRSRQ